MLENIGRLAQDISCKSIIKPVFGPADDIEQGTQIADLLDGNLLVPNFRVRARPTHMAYLDGSGLATFAKMRAGHRV